MKITDKIHLLRHDFDIMLSPTQKLPRFVNSLIIFGNRIILVDTGVNGCENRIFDYIEQNDRSVSDIETIILSHAHPDHMGAAYRIKERVGCKVWAHHADIPWIENIDLQNSQRPVPGFYKLVDTSVKVDRAINDGDVIKADENLSMNIIHAPGHSQGSINIFFVEDKILFTADAIPLKNDIPNYDHFLDLMKTLSSIKENKDYRVLLTSWTKPMLDRSEMDTLLFEGEEYMKKINNLVFETYKEMEAEPMLHCREVVKKLELPGFLVTPVVDNAFRSHLGQNGSRMTP